MAILTLTLTLKDNKKETYRFKTIEDLAYIDKTKEAEFIFSDLNIYVGHSDGKVDDEGYFEISQPGSPMLSGFPISKLIGWRYKSRKRKKD